MDKIDIDAMLQEMASSLPATQDNEEDLEEGEKGGGMSVFSRSDHLLSMGFQDSFNLLDEQKEHLHGNINSEKAGGLNSVALPDCTHTAQNVHGTQTNPNRDQTSSGDMEWDQFRTDFMEQLQSSNTQSNVDAEDASAIKKHLLMKAIKEMQFQNPGSEGSLVTQEVERPHRTISCDRTPSSDSSTYLASTDARTIQQNVGDNSNDQIGSSGHRSLLSPSLLAGIEMSALDRALQEIEFIDSSDTTDQKSDVLPQHPKMAWEESGDSGRSNAPDLISQLTAISNSILNDELEVDRSSHKEELSKDSDIVAGTNVNTHDKNNEDGKKTVYLDLRQPLSRQHDSDRVTCMHLNHPKQSVSESEESDDPMSWALKRKQVKSTLSPTKHSLHHPHTPNEELTENVSDAACPLQHTATVESSNEPSVDTSPNVLVHKRRKKNQKKKTDDENSENEVKMGKSGDITPRKLEDVSTQGADVGQSSELEYSIDVHNHSATSSESVLQSSSNSSIHSERVSNSLDDVPLEVQGIRRHHNTESQSSSNSSIHSERVSNSHIVLDDVPLEVQGIRRHHNTESQSSSNSSIHSERVSNSHIVLDDVPLEVQGIRRHHNTESQFSSSSSIHSERVSNSHIVLDDVPLEVQDIRRHHNTESFTLSSELSSFSEGEISPTKPIGAVAEIGLTLQLTTNETIVSGEGERIKTVTKRNKKKRKGKRGKDKDVVTESMQGLKGNQEIETTHLEKKQEVEKKKGKNCRKTEKSRKKKANSNKKPSVVRKRLDSLTTSSDEERVFDSPRLSRVVELVEERKVEGESEERLRQRLEHKIISKKPPAMFETPATEPLFHKDVSFSSVISHTYSSVNTDALLVLPLSPSCGLVSLPPSHSHISPETHLALHSLILTYLAVSAAQCSLHPSCGANQLWMGCSASPNPNSSKLPLKITALYQTVLDGQLSVLIGVSLLQGRKRSVSYPSVLRQDIKKATRSSGAILSPLDAPRNPFAIELDGILCGLKLKDLLQDFLDDSGVDHTEGEGTEGIVISLDILNEMQPLLEMSTQVFLSVYSDTKPLTKPTSFYWHSLYQPASLPTAEALCTTHALQSTVCALTSQSLSNPSLVYHALRGAYDFGLSIAGMQLVHEESCLPLDLPVPTENEEGTITDVSVALVLCLRGPDAISQCMDLVGPEDYNLALVTDPHSIMACYGSLQNQPMHCVRTPFRVHTALAKCFGGRACLHTGTVLGMTDPCTRTERRKRQRVRFSESEFESEDNLTPLTPDISFPPLVANCPLLTVLPYEQVLLVVSPLIPPIYYSSILATCSRLGFDISGIKRLRLNSKRAAVLDIPAQFASQFTPSSTPPSPEFPTFSGHPLDVEPTLDIPPLPSLLLIVCRENALIQCCALKTTIIADLKNLLSLNPHLNHSESLNSLMGALLHVVPYNLEKLKVLGSFSQTTVMSVSSLPQLAPEWCKEGEKYGEEISFLAVTQASGLTKAVELLQLVFDIKAEKRWDEIGFGRMQVERDVEGSDECNVLMQKHLGGFELLGIKLIPQLSRFHAKQLCPIPSSDHAYREAIELLSGSPAFIVVLRAITCNDRLQKLLTPNPPRQTYLSHHQSITSLSLITSNSFHQAFHYTTLFFTDRELFCDPASWSLLGFVPSQWARADVLHDYQQAPPWLYSVLVMKDDEWRILVKVMDRLCRVGFHICGFTMKRDDQQQESPVNITYHNCYEVAVCVSRHNAVWYLSNELRPYLSTTDQKKKLTYPTTFSDAVSLVQQYFPRGVCEPEVDVVTNYVVKERLINNFSGLQSGLPTHSPTSPITENTCLILPSSHLTSSHHPTPHYLQLLELIVQAGFSIMGIQLTHLSQGSATTLSAFGGNEKELLSGPCLILQLQRDNAASCFHYILRRSVTQYSVRGVGGTSVNIDDLLKGAVVPDSPKTAAAIIAALVKED